MKLILQAIKALFRKIEASRTHWEEVEEVEIIAETTVTITEDNSYAELPETTQLTVGQTYFVILDGVSYECVAWYSDDEEAVIIGNGAIFGGEGGNSEPFSCDSYSSGIIALNTEKAGTYTISISTMENVVHKLDKKYLPDEVIDSINNAQTTAEIHSDWNESDPNSPAYVENRTHYTEHYMRELEPVEYGPVALNGQVYIRLSNPDLAQVLERGIEGITVEYRFTPDAPWEVARGSVNTISATDVRYYFRDQSGTYIFYYHKQNESFYNNFSTSKDNLYIRVYGEVSDVRYIPLDVRFLPDTYTFIAWQYAGKCSGNLTPVTVGPFSEMWICGRVVSGSGEGPIKLKINGVNLGKVGHVELESSTDNVGYVDVHIAAVPFDDNKYLIVSKYSYSTHYIIEGQFQRITDGGLSTKAISNASNWMTETNTVTLSTDIKVSSSTLVQVLIR